MNEFDDPLSIELGANAFQFDLLELVTSSKSAAKSIQLAFAGVNKELKATGVTASATGKQMGSAFTQAFRSATLGGQKFSSVLKGLALNISTISLNAALKPLENLSTSLFSSLLGSFLPNAKGNAFVGGRVQAFASGGTFSQGVINQPSFFPMASGRLGLLGEAGPEAIMPLSRDAQGRLGISTNGSSGVSVTVNISTPDADSFRRSESQVSAMIARAVGRGQKNL